MENRIPHSSDRLLYMDNLRGFIIFLVVCHHALLPYYFDGTMEKVVNKDLFLVNFLLDLTMNDSFLMQVVFFLAGYFTYLSLKKGMKRFAKRKLIRIILPMLGASFLLAPINNYLAIWISGARKDFIPFVINSITIDFWSELPPGLLNKAIDLLTGNIPLISGHLWFIRALLQYYIAVFIIYAVFRKFIDRFFKYTEERKLPEWIIIVAIMAFISVKSLLSFYYISNEKLFSSYGAGLILCLINGEKQLITILRRYVVILFILIFLSADLEILLNDAIMKFNGKTLYLLLDFARILKSYLKLAFILALFNIWFNRTVPILTEYSKRSYGIYIFHPYIITLLSPLLRRLAISSPPEFLLSLTLPIVLSYLVSTLWSLLFEAITGSRAKSAPP